MNPARVSPDEAKSGASGPRPETPPSVPGACGQVGTMSPSPGPSAPAGVARYNRFPLLPPPGLLCLLPPRDAASCMTASFISSCFLHLLLHSTPPPASCISSRILYLPLPFQHLLSSISPSLCILHFLLHLLPPVPLSTPSQHLLPPRNFRSESRSPAAEPES